MPLAHARVPKAEHDRHVGLEGVDLGLDVLGDVEHLVHALPLLERLDGLEEGLHSGGDAVLAVLGVDFAEGAVHPLLRIEDPVVRRHPQLGEWLPLLLQLLQLAVVRGFLAEQRFAGVEQLRLRVGILEPLVDALDILEDFLDLAQVIVRRKAVDDACQVDEILIELGLFLVHMLGEAGLQNLQVLFDVGNEVVGLLGTTEHPPALEGVVVRHAHVETFQGSVGGDALPHVGHHLRHLCRNAAHEFLELGGLLNVRRLFSQLHEDAIE
mmetsp:Transcript_120675/g.385302  ORF Transcript_120675/g.385302 Transcript_120675/m.385302 type:complete len:268 (+) Transcript_120675:9679-10482(+)